MKQTMLQWCVLVAVLLNVSSLLLRPKLEPETRLPEPNSRHLTSFAATGHVDKQAPLVQRLKSFHNGLGYVGAITIGGVPQKAIFDTGSWDLVVFSKCNAASTLQLTNASLSEQPHPPGWNDPECVEYRRSVDEVGDRVGNTQEETSTAECCTPQRCPYATYDPTHSDSFLADPNGARYLIMYGSGVAHVRAGADNIIVPSSFTSGALKNKAPLKVVVDHSLSVLNQPDSPQAIVGVGPGKFDQAGERWMNHVGIQRYMFCFSKDPKLDGFVTWNDVDRRMDAQWKAVESDGEVHWAFKSNSFRLSENAQSGFGGVQVGCETGCGVVLDTGTSRITVPKDLLQNVHQTLQTAGVGDCSDLTRFPHLSFKLGNTEFSLPPESYIADVDNYRSNLLGMVHGNMSFIALPKTKDDAALALQASSEGRSTTVTACVLLLMSLPCPQPTQWGPLVIVGMPLFREYAVQFDLSEEPKRIVRLSQADPTCSRGGNTSRFVKSKPELLKMSIDELQSIPRSIERLAGPHMLY